MASNSYSVDFGGRRIIVDITETNHPETLKSTIGYSVKIRNIVGYYHYNYNNALQFRLGNDTLVNASNIRSIILDSVGQEIVLASGTWTFQHNDDGSGSFAVYMRFDQSGDSYPAAIINTTHVCNNISVATVPVLSHTSITIGSPVTITFSPKQSRYRHKVYYSFGSLANQTSGLSASQNIATQCTFTPPQSLASQIPNSPSGVCTITAETYDGANKIGTRTAQLTLLADSPPSVSVTLSEAGSVNPAFGFIAGKSNILVTATPTMQYGASPNGCSVTYGGVSYQATYNSSTGKYTATITNVVASATLTVTITDTRQATATHTQTVTAHAYTTPQIAAISPQRCDENGNPADQGTYAKVLVRYSIDGIDGNFGKWRLYYKTRSSSYFSAYNDWQSADSYDGYIVMSIYNSFQLNEEYDIMLSVTDTISGESNPYSVGGRVDRADCIMEIRGDGLGVSFGQFSTGPGLESHFETNKFNGLSLDDTIAGYVGMGIARTSETENPINNSSYPNKCGAFRIHGSFSGLPSDLSECNGVLLIVGVPGIYMHLYCDISGAFYSSRTYPELTTPSYWWKCSSSSITAK